MKKLTNKAAGTLKANDLVAEMIRDEMKQKNILLLNLVSSPGSGKTSLLEETIGRLKDKINIAVLEGDLETERDAERIRKQGVDVLQIITGGVCHLEAQMVHRALPQMTLDDIDILFIENVGSLACPASYDLGEDICVTLISCTEGDDKPKKYPGMFLTTDVMLVTKTDLLPYVPFSIRRVCDEAKEVNYDIQIFMLSSLSGDGLDEWCEFLLDKLKMKREKNPRGGGRKEVISI